MAIPGLSRFPADHRASFTRLLVLALAIAIAAVIQLSGAAAVADRAVESLRFAALARPASGRVVIVEMDARSAAAIGRWPWPRANYAVVVDRLRRAGAASITFDVEFSSRSTAGDDATFAAALARAGGMVALPTFAQEAGADDRRSLDAMPLAEFRPHVALASVSISPGADGLVRDAPLGTMTGGLPRPSLSAYMAHRSGAADAFFPINYAIRPDTIPRLSFVAVRDGRFDAAMVKGRDILIGATAIEMGDRYAVPQWSNLPGVVIQAIAAETLSRGVPGRRGGGLAIALAVLLATLICAARTPRQATVATLVAIAGLVSATLALQFNGVVLPIAGAALLLVLAVAGRAGLEIADRFRRQRLIDHDTGLPTRQALIDEPGSSGGLLVAAIDNLDSLAAVLPAGAEHQLVLRLAERLQVAVGDARVYRVADRLLAVPLSSGVEAEILADRLRALLLAPVEVAGRRADASVSIGFDLGEAAVEQRLATAILAAEDAGRRGSFWRPDRVDMAAVERDISLMGELDAAIAGGEIVVEYQPKLSLATGRITGAEALVRWRTATGKTIPPALFIPLAEQADRIAPLTLHVLTRVLGDLGGWLADGAEIAVAINMSAKLLGDARFDSKIAALLLASSVPPERLIFEVTESAALADADAAIASLQRFHALGVTLSMDDYGTGQSTLTYLRRLPLGELKIDRSFVQYVATDRKDEAMVRSTIELAHKLDLKVVAEGVEDAACLARLGELGCDIAQGYHIGRPMPKAAFKKLIERSPQKGEACVRCASNTGHLPHICSAPTLLSL